MVNIWHNGVNVVNDNVWGKLHTRCSVDIAIIAEEEQDSSWWSRHALFTVNAFQYVGARWNRFWTVVMGNFIPFLKRFLHSTSQEQFQEEVDSFCFSYWKYPNRIFIHASKKSYSNNHFQSVICSLPRINIASANWVWYLHPLECT